MNALVYLIIIIILLTLFFLYILFYYRNSNQTDNEIVYNYKDIKKDLKSGDIILFSCNKYSSIVDEIGYICRTKLLGTAYGHVGIVFNNNGNLFLVECTDDNHTARQYATHLNNKKRGGIRIIELDTIISEYYKENKGFFGVKFIEKEIPTQRMIDNILKYQNVIFEIKIVLIGLIIIDLYISNDSVTKISHIYTKNETIMDKMMCSEFVYKLLFDCDVVNYYPRKIFWPHLFVNGKFDELTKINYSQPLKFTYVD